MCALVLLSHIKPQLQHYMNEQQIKHELNRLQVHFDNSQDIIQDIQQRLFLYKVHAVEI